MILGRTEFLAKGIELKPDFEQFSDRRAMVDLSAPTGLRPETSQTYGGGIKYRFLRLSTSAVTLTAPETAR